MPPHPFRLLIWHRMCGHQAADIDAALLSRDWVALKLAAHALKGAAESCCCYELSEARRAL